MNQWIDEWDLKLAVDSIRLLLYLSIFLYGSGGEPLLSLFFYYLKKKTKQKE